MHHEIRISQPADPATNMEKDRQLLNSLATCPRTILHFYGWQGDCATYGYFIDPSQFFHLDSVQKNHLHLARRPTGGGIIFHHCDLAFSVLIPAGHPGYSLNTLDNYAFINRAVIEAVRAFQGFNSNPQLLKNEGSALTPYSAQFCMAKPTKYDVMLNGRKVGGGAQRRTKHGLLHQGTIALGIPTAEFLQGVLRQPDEVMESIKENGYALLPDTATFTEWVQARKEMQYLLMKEIGDICCSH
jgi:lipoate---protein ligase